MNDLSNQIGAKAYVNFLIRKQRVIRILICGFAEINGTHRQLEKGYLK